MPGRCAAPPAPAMMTLKPSGFRALGEGDEPVGRAMGRDDPRVVADAERFERLGGAAHDRPIRLAAHDDRDRFWTPRSPAPPCGESKSMDSAIKGRGRGAQATVGAGRIGALDQPPHEHARQCAIPCESLFEGLEALVPVTLPRCRRSRVRHPSRPAAHPRRRYEARCHAAYGQAGCDWLVVYADREHLANMAFLSGFEPRFEEALLLLGPGDRRVSWSATRARGLRPGGLVFPVSKSCWRRA